MKEILLSVLLCTTFIVGSVQATPKIDFENEDYRHKSTAPNGCQIYMCLNPIQKTENIDSKWYVQKPKGGALTIATCPVDRGLINGILIHHVGAYTGAQIDDEITAFLWELSTSQNWNFQKFVVWLEPGNPIITAENGTLNDRLTNPLFNLLTTRFGFSPTKNGWKNAFHNSNAPALKIPERQIQLEASPNDILKGLGLWI